MDSIAYLRLLQNNVKPRVAPPIEEILKLRSQQFNINIEDMRRILDNYDIFSLEGQEKFYRDFLIDPFLHMLPAEVNIGLNNIYIGILPTFNPNAFAVQVPDDGPLIILHTELLAAVSYYNELQILAGKHFLKNEIEAGLSLLKSGHQFVVDCFREDRPINYPILPPVLTEKELLTVQLKTLVNESFIIAHEFAHIYLGHLGKSGTGLMGIKDKKVAVNIYNVDQQMELDADVQSVKWLAYLGNKDVKHGALFLPFSVGIAVEVLMLIHIVEVNLPRDINTSSHPSAITRLQHISDVCSSILNKHDEEFINDMILNASDIDSFKTHS